MIFGTNLELVKDVKTYLSKNFDMKNLGEANIILGMKLDRTSNGILLTQSSVIENMLKKFGQYNSNPI